MAVTFQVGDTTKRVMTDILKENLLRVYAGTGSTPLGSDFYYQEVSNDNDPLEIATTTSNSKFESNNSVESGNALILPIIQGRGMQEIVLGKFDGTDYKVYGKVIINKSNPNNDDVVLINKIEVNITGG